MLRTTPRRFALLLALLAVVVTACSSVGETSAATINGHEISADSLRDELKIIRGNRQYREALEQQYGSRLTGSGKGTFGAAFTAQVLSLKIYYELLEQSLEERDALPTASEIKERRSDIAEQLKSLGGKKFAPTYIDELARQDALVSKAQTEAMTGDIGKEYFAEHKDEFVQACVSHVLVGTESRSEAEAEQRAGELKQELDGGADFAEVARANSDDPGSKETGGDLDCGPKGRFVEAFDDAVFSQPIGTVGEPVKTEFGFHLILVRSRSAASFEDAGEQLAQQAFQEYLVELTCGKATKVTINPSYGTWDRSPCKDGTGLPAVKAPTPPTTTKK